MATWRPILTGGSRAQALQTVEAIARSLSRPAFSPNDGPAERASLAGGKAGFAILYCYLALAGIRSGHKDASLRFLEEAVDGLASVPMHPSLYGGFTGVAWAATHIYTRLLNQDENSSEIDQALNDYLTKKRWLAEYDLVNGLVGFGVYSLERLRHRTARECLKKVIDHLEETAEEDADGITWHTSPELLPEWQREKCPRGYYNLGLAHGIPGVIALLGNAYAAGVQRRKTKRLLLGSVSWLLKHKLPDNEASIFTSWAGPDLEDGASRSAWCYGDPGIAVALLSAARALGEKSWEEEALRIARHVAVRPLSETRVQDAGICHGAAGLGHIFNRMFQATGKKWLKEAARFWFQRTLEMRKPGRGSAGYSAYSPEPDGSVRWVNEPSFLTGVTGIALALLAAATSVRPEWDRMLLVNIH